MKLFKKSKKTKKPVQPKKSKPVKKNTLYRKFRALVLRIEHRQMHDTPPIKVRDAETLVCKHCGEEFTGAYCPKCSMPARWKRFDWKLLVLNFLDIWGLGNRPMFRTIRDLFWRPGYMIRDYLRGHHLSYFPPFKMLAVWTIILLFMMWLFKSNTNTSPEETKGILERITNELQGLSTTSTFFLGQLDRVLAFLKDHLLYSIIIQNVLVVLAVKRAFRKVSDFNLVETFFSQIYINCQFHILAFLSMLFTWRVPAAITLFPYIKGLFDPGFVLTYDFHQLYGVTWKKALWKTIVTTFYLLILYAIVVCLIIAVLFATELLTNPESPLFEIEIE